MKMQKRFWVCVCVCDVCVYVSGSGSGSFIRSKYLRVVFEVNFFAYVGGFLITYNNIKIGKIRHTTRCVWTNHKIGNWQNLKILLRWCLLRTRENQDFEENRMKVVNGCVSWYVLPLWCLCCYMWVWLGGLRLGRRVRRRRRVWSRRCGVLPSWEKRVCGRHFEILVVVSCTITIVWRVWRRGIVRLKMLRNGMTLQNRILVTFERTSIF